MTLFKRAGTLTFIALLGVSVSVLAQQPEPGMMKQGHQMGGMSQEQGKPGVGMMEMHKKMQEMHQHSKMMEGMKDQQQLMREMKRHMRMMDEMMEQMMMQRQQGMTAPGREPEHQEHLPGKNQ